MLAYFRNSSAFLIFWADWSINLDDRISRSKLELPNSSLHGAEATLTVRVALLPSEHILFFNVLYHVLAF